MMFSRLDNISISFSPVKLIVTTLAVAAFTEILYGKDIDTGLKYKVLLPVLLVGVIRFFLIKEEKNANNMVKIFFLGAVPYFFAFAYSCVIFVIDHDSNYAIERPLSITVRYIYAMASTVAFLVIFKENSVEQLLKVLNISYVITFLSGMKVIGLKNTLFYILNIEGQVYNKYFEAHTIGLTIGILILYKMLFATEGRFNFNTIFGLFVFYLCHKRIAFIAFSVTLIIGFWLGKAQKRFSQLNINVLLLVLFSSCAAFAFITSTGTIYDIFSSLGLNALGRKLMVSVFSNMYTLSPLYLGKGMGFTSLYLEKVKLSMRYRNMKVFANILHNDIFRIYIELGFAGFILWFRYYYEAIPRKLSALFGDLTTKVYCVISIYAAFVYMTDNAMDYFIFQMSLFVCIGNAVLAGSQR